MLLNKFFILIIFIGLLQLTCTQRDIPDHMEVIGINTPEVNLNGTWKFSMNTPETFWEDDIDFSDWEDIQVPGECQMQGFAIKHDQAYVYKYDFLIPMDFQDQHISLDFHGVYSYARVWVNGHFLREHFGGFTKWQCDLTKVVTPGESATLTVEIVDRLDDISYASGYAKHQIGGILRDVVLSAQPKQHFKQLYFETDLDDKYLNAALNIYYELSEQVNKLKFELYDSENILVSESELMNPETTGEASILVDNPLKWDAEHPNLYTVVSTIYKENKEVLKAPRKIGFREVVVDGNRLLVNGKPVKLRGACRHDIHPTLGRMTNAAYDKQDVLLAKEANMNFIRTSHYPPSEAFLNYCDEYGIYVEDETAVCFVGSHRTFDYQASGASQNLSNYTDRYLSQLEEMVVHHRNHPSVIIWSIGNENVFGSNFIKSYKWVKENDPTRPIIYSYPGPVPDSVRNFEILSMHYPDWKGNLNQYGISTKGFAYDDMPVLFDEWAHVACYNNPTLLYDPNVRNFWGQSLDSMWTNVFDADGGLGCAIWCMIDETFMLPKDMDGYNEWWGKLDPNVIPATYMGPTVGYGEWGIIDTWRRKKPEFWATKKAYSPTKVLAKQILDFTAGEKLTLPVHNRLDHTNFSEIEISYQYGDYSDQLKNVSIEPHKKGELSIPAQQWESGKKLHLSFKDRDGALIDEYLIQLGEPEILIPDVKKGGLKLSENENQILINGVDYSLVLNKKTGLLNDVIVKGETLIKSGPYINLMLPGKRTQYSTIQMADYAKNWKCNEFNYKISEGIITINSIGMYDSISASFEMKIDAFGVFSIGYEITNVPEGKNIQESGITFIVGNQYKTLDWNRIPYFTTYPPTDLGSANREVNLSSKPAMIYREKPNHDWEMDTKGFFYHGLEDEFSYTNIVRSMKENIISYGLSTASTRLSVFSDGSQACRFDKIDEQNILLINDQWDYQSLLWGNYMKMIPSAETFRGHVTLKIDTKEL